MATLIPAISSCASRMTGGERRLAERLETKLEDDYLLWYDVPVGPKQFQPDFIVLHPRRGILILETKDWYLSTVQKVTPLYWDILDNGRVKTVANPLRQARNCAVQVVQALEKDPQLVQAEGSHKGKLAFAWAHGVVFTRITRKQFDEAGFGEALEAHHVICADEMYESVDAEAFQKRLWDMFPHTFGKMLSLPQIDRVRWLMFPQVRIATQASLFDDDDPTAIVPDVMQVMDLQQEQLARSLGDGHRVIHGVAGSGKTMILGYRAEYLAQGCTQQSKPILVLCFNRPLAAALQARFASKGLNEYVHVHSFLSWCRQQLVAFGQDVPQLQGAAFYEALVQSVIQGVNRKHIPGGQYRAILIDEGHDFQPEWFRLVTQMIDPDTNSLLVLYDDAQSIYEHRGSRAFSFKSVGIQAQGRTTILKINYRNTRQILELAHRVAADILQPEDKNDDGVPLLRPISGGRDGKPPVLIRFAHLRGELRHVAESLAALNEQGHAWGDMAVLCPNRKVIDDCARTLRQWRLPCETRSQSHDFHPDKDNIHVMSMHASKGLEFPVVALAGVGDMHVKADNTAEAVRLFYVAATRATHHLIVTASGHNPITERLGV